MLAFPILKPARESIVILHIVETILKNCWNIVLSAQDHCSIGERTQTANIYTWLVYEP